MCLSFPTVSEFDPLSTLRGQASSLLQCEIIKTVHAELQRLSEESTMGKDWNLYAWLRISLLLYLAACCSPALLFRTFARDSLTPVAHDAMWGFQVLLKGYLGLILGIIAWYANPL